MLVSYITVEGYLERSCRLIPHEPWMDMGYEIIEHLVSVSGVWVDVKEIGGVIYTKGHTIFNFVASAKLTVVYAAWYLAVLSKSWG